MRKIMTITPKIDWTVIEPLTADLPLDREEVEGTIEAMMHVWNQLHDSVVVSTEELIEQVGADVLREILYLLSAHRLAEVA